MTLANMESLVSGAAAHQGGWVQIVIQKVCASSDSACLSGTGNISDTVNVPVGATLTYTVLATISSSATGTMANTATVPASQSRLAAAQNSRMNAPGRELRSIRRGWPGTRPGHDGEGCRVCTSSSSF